MLKKYILYTKLVVMIFEGIECRDPLSARSEKSKIQYKKKFLTKAQMVMMIIIISVLMYFLVEAWLHKYKQLDTLNKRK